MKGADRGDGNEIQRGGPEVFLEEMTVEIRAGDKEAAVQAGVVFGRRAGEDLRIDDCRQQRPNQRLSQVSIQMVKSLIAPTK